MTPDESRPGNDPTTRGPALPPNSPGQAFYVPGTPQQPLRVEVIQRSGKLWKFLFFGCLAFALLMLIWASAMTGMYAQFVNPNSNITEQNFVFVDDTAQQTKQLTAKSKIAVITVEGAIMHQDGFAKNQIDAVRKDDDVVAVVLRVDSPGGTVTGSHYLWHHLKKLRDEKKIPIVVSMGGICASGGYYISMAVGPEADTVWAEETTWTGSIGVIIPHYDLSGLIAKWDIKDDSIMSHPLKAAGSMTKELTPEERKLFQDLVDESFKDFKAIVQQGRPKMDQKAIDDAATGQIFTAKQALSRGLVDKLGFLEDAVQHAAKLAGKDLNDVRAVKYKKPDTLFGDISLLGQSPVDDGAASAALRQFQTLTTPRAYFLWPAALPAAKE